MQNEVLCEARYIINHEIDEFINSLSTKRLLCFKNAPRMFELFWQFHIIPSHHHNLKYLQVKKKEKNKIR